MLWHELFHELSHNFLKLVPYHFWPKMPAQVKSVYVFLGDLGFINAFMKNWPWRSKYENYTRMLKQMHPQ